MNDYTKFNLYPFATIVLNKDNKIIFKNTLTKHIYPEVHVGACISMYSDIKEFNGLTKASFLNSREIIFSYEMDNCRVLMILVSVLCNDALFSGQEKIKGAIDEFINSESERRPDKKFINEAYKRLDDARTVGNFVRNYTQRDEGFFRESVTVLSTLEAICTAVKESLGLNLELSITDNLICTDDKNDFFLMILSCLTLGYTLSCEKAEVTNLSGENGKGVIVFKLCNCKRTPQDSKDFISVMLGVAISEEHGFDYEISQNKENIEISFSFSAIESPKYVFCDTNKILKNVREYTSFLDAYFENSASIYEG